MKPLGDRRARARFEVVGSFWGTVEIAEPAHVVNINRTGALLASRSAMAADSTQVVWLTLEGRELPVDTRVRYLRHVPGDGAQPQHYLIGLEFLSTPPSLAETIDHLVSRSASTSQN